MSSGSGRVGIGVRGRVWWRRLWGDLIDYLVDQKWSNRSCYYILSKHRRQPSNLTSLRAPATEFRSIAFLRSWPSTLSLSLSSSPPALRGCPFSTVEPSTPALAVRELDSELTTAVFLFSTPSTPLVIPLLSSAAQEDDSPVPVTAPIAKSDSLSSFSSSRKAETGGKPEAVAVGLEADEATWALRRLR